MDGKRVLWVVALALGALVAGGGVVAGQAGPPPRMFVGAREHAFAIGSATRLLEAHRSSTGVPGMQVAVSVHGRLIWSAGLGHADVASGEPVGRETRFRIGSTSKALTATLAAILAEEGVLDLDAPVQRWVPSFPESSPPITPLKLVGHTSGIRHYEGPDELHRTRRYATMLEAVELFATDPLRATPGSSMVYSSYGYNLLGAVLEAATGMGYLEALSRRVTEPLGMTHTGGVGELGEGAATPYVGSRDAREPAGPEDFSSKWPGGGLESSAEDLVRFGEGLLEGALLDRAAVDRMWTSLTTSDGAETGYGFGWGLYRDRSDRFVVSHAGNLDSGRAHLFVYPDLELVVAIVANTGESIYFNEGEAFEIGDLFARSLESGGTDAAPLPASAYGTWSFEGESPFGDGGTLTGELVLHRPQGPVSGSMTFEVGGAERTVPLGLAERVNGRTRLIAVGGTHLELLLDLDGDAFEGVVRPAWTAPPAGMLRTAPSEVRALMAARGADRPIGGRRRR